MKWFMRSTATPPGASNAAGAAVCSIQQTSAPKKPAFDLSENGRKLAHATARVCSEPTAAAMNARCHRQGLRQKV